MKSKLAVLAAALMLSGAASAQTTSVFNLVSGSFSNVYSFTATGPSTVTGSTNSSGVTWTSLVLFSASPSYSAVDTNPDNGFTFTGLAAGNYTLTFSGSGNGGYGGYYTVASAVPEATTASLMLAGLGILGGVAVRRRRG